MKINITWKLEASDQRLDIRQSMPIKVLIYGDLMNLTPFEFLLKEGTKYAIESGKKLARKAHIDFYDVKVTIAKPYGFGKILREVVKCDFNVRDRMGKFIGVQTSWIRASAALWMILSREDSCRVEPMAEYICRQLIATKLSEHAEDITISLVPSSLLIEVQKITPEGTHLACYIRSIINKSYT